MWHKHSELLLIIGLIIVIAVITFTVSTLTTSKTGNDNLIYSGINASYAASAALVVASVGLMAHKYKNSHKA